MGITNGKTVGNVINQAETSQLISKRRKDKKRKKKQ